MNQEEVIKSTTEEITAADIDAARNMGLSYYKLSSIQPGSPVVLEIVKIAKLKGAKYTLKGKDYSLRCTLGTGQVMDVTSIPVAGEFTRLGYGQGDTFKPFRVKISRKPTNKIGETPYIIVKE